jgi:hypothetical protein
MSIRNYSNNAFCEEFDVLNQYGYVSHHYLRVIREHEISFNSQEIQERENMLDLGFAPAVTIYKSFDEFLKHTRDF